MQVLPKTMLNPGFGIRPADPNDPNDIARVGGEYANTMLGRYGGSPVLAAAAYNAGPGRVDQWRKQFGDPLKGEISDEEWAQKIPYKETKNYVQRALGILQRKMEGPDSMTAGATPPAPTTQTSAQPPAAPTTQTSAPAALPAAAPAAAQKRGGKAMALLQTLLPKDHVYVQVDHDPWDEA
jgi:hypothetical protein